jgi:hypothetical protein
MPLGTPDEADQDRRAATVMKELAGLADALTGLDYLAHTAAASGNFEALCGSCEQLLSLHVRFAGLYRTLLVVKMRPSRSGRENEDLLALPGVDGLPERMSW